MNVLPASLLTPPPPTEALQHPSPLLSSLRDRYEEVPWQVASVE